MCDKIVLFYKFYRQIGIWIQVTNIAKVFYLKVALGDDFGVALHTGQVHRRLAGCQWQSQRGACKYAGLITSGMGIIAGVLIAPKLRKYRAGHEKKRGI